MEDIKKAQQRLVNAIVAMHPQLCMGDEKQEELYLAMHDLTIKMAKLNENGGLHLQRVNARFPDKEDLENEVKMYANAIIEDTEYNENRIHLEYAFKAGINYLNNFLNGSYH